MAKLKEKERALLLRKGGKSYNQIKQIIKVSKSSLSLWLRDNPLPEWRIRELRDHSAQRIEKFRATMLAKKNARLDSVYKKQKRILFPFTKRDLFIAGLFLYWGEGEKAKSSQIGISNSDPAVILFFIYWAKDILKVCKKEFSVKLHLYSDMNIRQETAFWSRSLGLPLPQFRKPYIKKSESARINFKNGFGHGTCNILIGDVHLHERVLMSIKCIQDFIKTRGA